MKYILPGLIVLALSVVWFAAIARDNLPGPPFVLPDLPYAEDALAPVIDADTMRLHHGRHHQAYVDNLNAHVANHPQLKSRDLHSLLNEVSRHDAVVRNNAGGHYNHSLFWSLMAPVGDGGKPSVPLRTQIDRDFGSFEAFVEKFEAAARGIFGSGWVWLIAAPDGSLAITTTANQDNPLMDFIEPRGTPLLALDVWEHAYYLQYQNRRAAYISAWWNVVNWNEVNRKHQAAD